jgi:hypothetical protein
LRSVAKWADHWDMTAPENTAHWKSLSDTLDSRCSEIGRDPSSIRRSIHLMWQPDADPVALAARGAEFGAAGVDLVIYSMRGPYEVRLLDPLANALRLAGG